MPIWNNSTPPNFDKDYLASQRSREFKLEALRKNLADLKDATQAIEVLIHELEPPEAPPRPFTELRGIAGAAPTWYHL